MSVIHLPFFIADLAFAELKTGGELFLKIVLLPNLRIFALLLAIDFCWNDHLFSHAEISFSNSFTFTHEEWEVLSMFLGKLFQNEGFGGLS